MKRFPILSIPAAAVVAALAAAPAPAQEHYSFTASLLGGIGGSLDENDAGYGNPNLQLGFSTVTTDRVHVGLRIGELSFDADEPVGRLRDASLTYLTVAGEYRYPEALYDSGVFLGLGLYDLEGAVAGGGVSSEMSLGLTGGATGDWDLSRRFSIVAELSAHLVDSDEARIFLQLQAGVAYHF